ncbi:MAG TPA: PilC/PilY family type IV pilus protein [Casimicrobiaceae bacterium]|nr:PilC/PilY family type IV pilus protein [Casimicrobiaceae bacterium]
MSNRPQSWKRTLATLLSLQIALSPLEPAFAQLTKLADEPIGMSPTAPPNIMLTVDDSTSMRADFLPDYVVQTVPGSAGPVGGFCRDVNGLMNVPCGTIGSPSSPGYVYAQGTNLSPATPYQRYHASFANSTVPDWPRMWPAPAHNAALNRLYYDPAITYSPPLNYDGTAYPNQTTMTSVVADPWAAVKKYENMTQPLLVGMWCNTDWPSNPAVNNLPTNTANWDPKAGGGADCRINGTDYSGIVGNAAPADYMYPWRKSSGVDDPKYYWRSGPAKTLWCDPASAKWPKVLPCTNNYGPGSCPGGTYIPPGTDPQQCFDKGVRNGCVGPVTYSPAGCNTNPAYGAPGPCVGSECLVCNTNACPTGPVGRVGRCHLKASGTGGSGANCDCSPAGCTVNPTHAACTPYPKPGIGTCSNGITPVPVSTTCSNAGGGCGVKLYDPIAKTNSGLTMLQDANGPGEVCRRNNQAYAGVTASPFNYPKAPYTSAQSGGCGSIATHASIKRHYWKTSVEWCVNKITTANDKWNGFGLAAAGQCQDEHDIAHPFPRYYKYGVRKTDPEYLDNYTYGAFERVDLEDNIGVTHTHTFYDKLGQLQTIVRNGQQEMRNYANWFAYYRTRIQAAKTVISQNFSYLDDQFRVGFHTLSNNPASSFVNIAPFDALAGGQKQQWYTQLFNIDIQMGRQTPNMDAVVRIGELFKNGGSASLAGATDPITLSCQKNYHMLFTDGITNQPALPAVVAGNMDNMVPPLPQPIAVVPPIVAGSAWPALYRENTGASLANTMADFTTKYWVTDLRPAMTNNVPPSTRDPAPWQHLNFAALSLGTEGTLAGASPPAVEAKIAAGTVKWPTPVPNPFQPNATGVDDLWHAAVNSRGRFVNAKTSAQLGRGIANILSDITSPAGSGSGPTFANPNISAGNNHTYVASFEQGWGGTVQKVQVDTQTLAPLAVVWDAKTQLNTQLTVLPAPNDKPWYTNRRVVTVNESGIAVPFLPGNLGPTQISTLGPDLAYQTRVIEYVRGRRDQEGDDDGQFRIRSSPIGDIVDSQPMIIGPADQDLWPFDDANDPGYSAFWNSQLGRPKRIYVGANDGMMHVFDEATGDEVWAFIPRDFYRSAPPVSNDKAGLIGLTYQPGGLPIYDHRFYVNATPRVMDADLAGMWKTIVVGGLGKGGKSYFALDATNPGTVTTEAAAASKFLWEFRHADLGFTYGRATIVKTRAHGWTVIVPSGYNNASGEGKIFILRASDGALLKTMSTSAGTPGNPSGLAHIAGFTKDFRNQVVEQIYGGDLFGNLWRFDLSDPNSASWVVEKMAVLTDAGGAAQPITTPPRIDIDVANGVDRWVFIGTGKLTHECDLTDFAAANPVPCTGNPNPNQVQTMYAIRDGTLEAPWTIAAPIMRSTPGMQAVTGIAGLGANVISPKGWYDDLNDQPGLPPGRIIKTPVATVGLIAYIASSQPIDPCEVGLPATIYVRQFGNGESKLTNGVGGPLIESLYEPQGAGGFDVVATYPPGCTPGACVPDIKLVVLSTQTQILTFGAKLPGITGERRMSWGQLGQ